VGSRRFSTSGLLKTHFKGRIDDPIIAALLIPACHISIFEVPA
jgi:hypothetical protein